VQFEPAALAPKARLPRTLFDTVADNLIRNALAKRALEPKIDVRVSLEGDSRLTLRVRDDGSPVPEALEAALMRAPVASKTGLGIGLYQAARLAEAASYSLSLERNLEGDVRFTLSGPLG
jgi:signal transduction histidine kinase